MDQYQKDRSYSDQFISAIQQIVGPRLLQVASFQQDTAEATDLVVLRSRPMDIACRIRRPGYADLYPNDFTIRSQRQNGGKTELDKVIDGYADWMFYGHASETGVGINPWHLIDLSAFRSHLIRVGLKNSPGYKIGNRDGTGFAVFSTEDFPSNLIIDSSLIKGNK